MDFKHKNVLVTGGTGMIGRELVKLLKEKGAYVVVTTIDKSPKIDADEILETDLRYFDNCQWAVKEANADIVFHCAGIKGSPKMCKEKPARFSVPMLQFNTNMMEAAMEKGVEWYLFTSSIGVYYPEPILKEERVWETYPSENDKFAGWAKRMGELQAEAYAIELSKKNISIVRPANVYGSYDNFDPENAMVIPSLIKKCSESETIDVWGDGSQVRDFIHARDVARAMMFTVENEITEPLNVGSNTQTTVKDVVEAITKSFDPVRQVNWDTSKPTGDQVRVLDSSKLVNHGFTYDVPLSKGIQETVQWFMDNQTQYKDRYNPFTEGKK